MMLFFSNRQSNNREKQIPIGKAKAVQPTLQYIFLKSQTNNILYSIDFSITETISYGPSATCTQCKLMNRSIFRFEK